MIKKKIFIVSQSANSFKTIFKGIPKYLSNTYSIYLLGPSYKDYLDLEKKENIKYIPLLVKRKITILSDLVFLLQSINVILKIQPAIIHSFFPKPVLIMAIAAYLCRVQHRVITFTGLVFPSRSGFIRKLLFLFDKLSCAISTKVLAEGKDVKDEMINFKITNKEILVIGNGNISGVDVKYFDPKKDYSYINTKISKNLFNNKKTNLIYVGRMSDEKGINELLEAYDQSNKDCNLILVGDYESDKIQKKVEERKKLGLDIYHFDYQNDVRPFYFIADVFVLPSYREGFSNVLLEAGSMALPALVTDVNGSREIIDNNINGWIIPIKDVSSIKDKLNSISQLNNNLLIEMGNKFRNKVVKLYSHEEQKSNILHFYNSLTNDL